MITKPSTMSLLIIPPILASGTRSRIPARLIILFSKMGARDERLVQVSRIVDDAGNHEPAFAIRFIGAIVILCRSEEHTSELQSLAYLVCRLLLEKKKNYKEVCYGGRRSGYADK